MAEGEVVVYKRGEVQKRIDPTILQFVMLDDIQVALSKVNRHLGKAEFEGILDPRVLSATDELQELAPAYDWPFTPWICAYFINDGPDEVVIVINDSEAFTMKLKETQTIDQTHANERIRVIYYKCNPGESASVRVRGQF